MTYLQDLSLPPARPGATAITPGPRPSAWRATPAGRRMSTEQRSLRRVGLVWALLFFNVLGTPTGSALKIPHSIEQILTQGSLVGAFILALALNPRARVRPNILLGLYSLLAIMSVMMSIRFVSLGADYRAFRLVGFLVVLWLLTPWWGRLDLVILRSQMRFLMIIMGSVVIGMLIAPGLSFFQGRLGGAIWPIPATQLAHYSAELASLAILLWMCRLVSRRWALLVVVPSIPILLLTHTRTALIAAIAGLLVAGLSLFAVSRRVRRILVTVVIAVAVVGVPLSPFIVSYLARGESGSQLTTLTGRTSHWDAVLSEPRPETNKIFGSGMTNDEAAGLAIDSSWLTTYQNQGLVGDVLIGSMFVFMLINAFLRPRGPARAIALYLIVYCIIASFTESGMGEASQYALDMAVAASLLLPARAAAGAALTRAWLGRPAQEPGQ